MQHAHLQKRWREKFFSFCDSACVSLATCFPLFVTAASGNLAPKSASGLTFNSNTDVLSGTFSGNLTGNVTGDVSGSSGSCTGNSATATALQTGRTIALTGDVTLLGCHLTVLGI